MNQRIATSDAFGPWVECCKMQGSGNDFVVLDNRALQLAPDEMPDWAKAVCRKAFGVGADGLILLDTTPPGVDADYIWHFYNADGSRAEMCGNGSRCAARLAHELGLAERTHVLGTDAGPIKAEVLPDQDMVKVQLTPHHDLRLGLNIPLESSSLDASGQTATTSSWEAHFVNTGVPHLVVFSPDVAALDVQDLGRRFRNHPRFAPNGTNVNFIQVQDRDNLLLRTYERGVEGETYACGTGAAASALIAHSLGRTGPEVNIRTSGGELLGITIGQDAVFLTGNAVLVFMANLNLRSLGLSRTEP
ncbi:diaminopimelate epimerase [Desulfonatronum sp. SC1]|uniref:diaminopimelate epimerase n=1 Tax=Desulfonatronum sp. SC1 TaxID=2109626 RepID=UPI000D2FD548|nr:diaminopimelate epimerase [Desulfonatronum sp. SC1]PTN38065.1 diaminopimelate epimerase [Desulfonatronum sp. SC1]